MKKKIMNLLDFSDLGKVNKVVKLNNIFTLVGLYFDENGINVNITGKPVNEVNIRLQCCFPGSAVTFRTIDSTEYQDIVKEVSEKMQVLIEEQTEIMRKNFENGYIY